MTDHHDDTIELPASTSTGSKYSSPRLFGRTSTVHELLGGGKCADVLLWKKKHHSAAVLGFATLIYVLFDLCGYTVISVVANTLLFLSVVLFAWSNGASFLNRRGPSIPEIQFSEELVQRVAHDVKNEFNKLSAALRSIVLGRNWLAFLKVSVGLWILSVVGAWCDLLTLVYFVIIVAHFFPIVYDKYEDKIEHYANLGIQESKKQYQKIDELVMKKIPRAAKEKKSE